jgi:hypothetical protein
LHDPCDYPFQICSDFFSRNAKRFQALLTKPMVAPFVTSRPVSKIVCKSVDLDDDTGSFAEKIEHDWAKRMLSAELQAVRAHSKYSPEPDLCRTHAFAELASLVNGQMKNPSTMLRMVPLPSKCRGG